MQPGIYRTLLLERLRLPLHITEGSVRVWRKARPSGTPQGSMCRAMPTKRTLARVCREAGAVVRTKVKLRDMHIPVSATDELAIEVLAMGLPLHQGAQLAIDTTLRSALTTTGEPCPGGATMNGAALQAARQKKEAKYRELLEGHRCSLIVVGVGYDLLRPVLLRPSPT